MDSEIQDCTSHEADAIAPAGTAFAPCIERERAIAPSVERAIRRTTRWLLERQHDDGYWCGELQGDTILESEYILLLAWLGRKDSPLVRKAAAYILQQQNKDGGWSLFPGGEIDISGSVKAYFALKIAGHDPDAEYMRRARDVIRQHGGADAVNSFTRFYLALLGQISYDHCPAVPPEAVLAPAWFPLSIYRISAWSRTILVPLAIMWAHRPTCDLDPRLGIGELFLREPDEWPELRCPGLPSQRGWFTWEKCFRRLDRALKWCERYRIRPLRKRALAAAEKWMLDRFDASDGLGAIFPPIIWSVVALKCQGYSDNSPEVAECLKQLGALIIEEDETVRLQPCQSPVWDTAIAVRALAGAGASLRDEPMQRAAAWLLKKEVRRAGDWTNTVKAEPAGWYFEFNNEFYPDVDDTIMVMMALAEVLVESHVAEAKTENITAARRLVRQFASPHLPVSPSPSQIVESCERARRWILAMQNRDGGWGAFDKDNDHEFLCYVPFADHNAMIDPSTPDITARVLEALAGWGTTLGHPAVDRAVDYIRASQEADGSWFGRWGVNYIYGTWQVIVGLIEVGVPADDPMIRRGCEWLIKHQQACGGWGETAESYNYPELRGQGPVTASQTAWALLGLLAANLADHPAVEKGIQYLVDSQRPDGGWNETEFTGTGFPRVFYLRYHLYPIYFPLMALNTFRNTKGQ